MTDIPVLQIVGYKNSGKTTLIENLVRHLKETSEIRIAVIKHHKGTFPFDKEGKDTWKYRQAGASAAAIQSPGMLALSMDHQQEKTLAELIGVFRALGHFELILVEGYKWEAYPKAVLIRNREDFAELSACASVCLYVFEKQTDYDDYMKRENPGIPALLRSDEAGLTAWVRRLLPVQNLICSPDERGSMMIKDMKHYTG
ncbi:molybdopterin-guanine dinucleotide biosynthesis protein B [Ferviditalea candida]|uniref:Molybdopterin-guanine dinucleotide biosynthesis protein B n=1 Tax=Ferviditalea candida TaxID=3108399 RepID=A0ABU5ZJG4_9BACL|nr:molybdopterin-guanine dinucleotide biosynthesis protein B [Paenibacillaceae bacterium T2]